MLPYGELLRGFASQGSISKGEMKKVLRGRGVFFKNNEKEDMVPCLTTLLLSPSEFDILKDCQNTREDNPKKSSSRIELDNTTISMEHLPKVEELQGLIASEYNNYELTKPPEIIIDKSNLEKFELTFEIERYDLNKSWYESKNVFTGGLLFEKVSDGELLITKSYTSPETEDVANRYQNLFIQHFKSTGIVKVDSILKKILFGDFANASRIQFFFKLTTQMDGLYFNFIDVEDMEFRPDENETLPEGIEWMEKKKALIMKGEGIHNTSFLRELTYHPFLQVWGLEAKYKYEYSGVKGTCIVNYVFRDFNEKQGRSEFEINISSINYDESSLSFKQKMDIKQGLLGILDKRKNDLYKSFSESKLAIEKL